MKRWDLNARKKVEARDVDDFLAEIMIVCRRHDMTILHECDGDFIVKRVFDPSDHGAGWLMRADVDGKPDLKRLAAICAAHDEYWGGPFLHSRSGQEQDPK